MNNVSLIAELLLMRTRSCHPVVLKPFVTRRKAAQFTKITVLIQ